MTLYDYLQELKDNSEELTNVLIQLDNALEYLHNHGFCIYDFEPKKIVLYDKKLKLNSFAGLLNDINVNQNAKQVNIYQLCKIGLFAYNGIPVDGNMNMKHYNFLQTYLQEFNKRGQIPSEIYEYYEDVLLRTNIVYLNDYLVQKKQELNGNQSTNVRRKSKTTSIGTAFANNEAAYVNVLFLPTIITLIYILSLVLFIIF